MPIQKACIMFWGSDSPCEKSSLEEGIGVVPAVELVGVLDHVALKALGSNAM